MNGSNRVAPPPRSTDRLEKSIMDRLFVFFTFVCILKKLSRPKTKSLKVAFSDSDDFPRPQLEPLTIAFSNYRNILIESLMDSLTIGEGVVHPRNPKSSRSRQSNLLRHIFYLSLLVIESNKLKSPNHDAPQMFSIFDWRPDRRRLPHHPSQQSSFDYSATVL